MTQRLLCILILLSIFFKDYAQTQPGQTDINQPVVPQPIPPSPTAASLGKYGETPVSLYTGIPNISVPIWQIKEGDIEVPISLSYHSGGIKVEENASWVGLGWSLNAGGVITRAMRGKPDEVGYLLNTVSAGNRNNLMPPLLLDLPNLGPNSSLCDGKDAAYYASNVAAGGFDSEPDLYFFNFNGVSGKFVLDQNGVAYTIPYQKIKIERVNGTGWRITTPDGMQYNFGGGGATQETTRVTNYTYSGYGGAAGDFPSTGNDFPSAWYLTSIQSPTGHTVSFSYVGETYEQYSGQSQSLMWDISNASNFSTNNVVYTTGSKSDIAGVRLSAISFSNGHVDFIATRTRQDIDDLYNPNLLEKIAISNSTGGVIKNFVLNTDYFVTNDPNPTSMSKRLRLNSLTEYNGDMSASKPPYVFSYDNSGPMPSKMSTSQDHWGYYNGKSNLNANQEPTLIPDTRAGVLNVVNEQYFEYGQGSSPISDNYYNNGVVLLHYTGADRTPDFNFAKIGTLNKITYPTGGYTLFEYEPHDYDLKPSNYVYASTQYGLTSNSSPAPGINVGAAPENIVQYAGDLCYNTKTINFSPYINATNSGMNSTISTNLTFSFLNMGLNFYCCGYYEPEATLKDLTTNKMLLDIQGREGIPQIMDQSIRDQITAGTLTLEGNFNYQFVLGDPNYWNSAPYFKFINLQLDPTHTYELKTMTWQAPATACESRASCPMPSSDLYSSSNIQMVFSINGTNIIKYNGAVGGFRIKKISDFSNLSAPTIRQYTYRQSASPQISSGVIIDMPSYVDQGRKNITNANAGDPFGDKNAVPVIPVFISSTNTKFLSLTSGSKFELGQTSGSYVGYKEVTESFCADNSCTGTPVGKKIYHYTSADDYKDINTKEFGYAFWGNFGSTCTAGSTYNPVEFGLRWATPAEILPTDNRYPYPPKNNYDWKRGLLTSEETYDNNGVLRKKIESAYNFVDDNNNRKTISGLKMVTAPRSRLNDIYFARYDIIAAWNYKTQDKVTEIDVNNNQTVTTTNYFYDNPALSFLTRMETNNSKGELLRSTYSYAGDLSSQVPYNSMNSRFQINPLVMQSNYNNGNFLESKTTNYRDWGNGIIEPETVQTNFLTNAPDTRLHFYGYDSRGNMLAGAREKDLPMTYIYDYFQNYPIAQVANPAMDVAAYTSFEANGTGGWSLGSAARNTSSAITGNRSYTLNSDISCSGLNASNTYIVSYWTTNSSAFSIAGTVSGYPVKVRTSVLNGSIWNCYEHKISGQTQVTLGGSGLIDELRLYASGALMHSYTYTPLVGMTTACTPNNVISRYEYDDMLRLTRIRDIDNNIVKQFTYNYQSAVTIYSSVLKSGVFTRNNCSNSTPGTATYTVVAGAYTSGISQADADAKAQNDVNANGQAYANANAVCIFPSSAASGTFTRSNCPSGATPGTATYTVAAGAYTSTISAADATAKAQNDVNVNGQNYANANAVCTFYSVSSSNAYTRNNCPSGAFGQTTTYIVPAGKYTSTISQDDADAKARADVNANGQNYVNNNVSCVWYSSPKSGTFYRNNCPNGGFPGKVVYNVPYGTYTSTINQADADAKAQNDVNANGQNYANANGSCTAPATFSVSNSTGATVGVMFTNTQTGDVFNLLVNGSSGSIVLPVGTYNVVLNASSGNFNYSLCGRFAAIFSGNVAIENNVAIGPGSCTSVSLDPNGD